MTSPAGDRLGLGSDQITWERFEQFSLALLNALPEVESATRYGGSGEPQEGIDIEVRFTDGSNGGVQCRQRARFGKPEFDAAVSDNEYTADRHIVMTTGPATVPARRAEREAPSWEIWDIDDIGVKVRQRLPRVDARWLIEDHLGAAERRDFLGPDGPLTLARWDRHFAPLLRPDRLFSHTVELIGRDEVLGELVAFLRDEARQVLVLPGRGGTGKSRLLLEFGRRCDNEDRPILFAMDGVTLTPTQLDAELPAGPAVLVLDDAHRRPDIAAVLNYAARREELKLVVVTRPLRIEELDAALVQAGFDASNLRRLEPLSTLDFDDARRIASAAVAEDSAIRDEVLDALGEITRDCQLITVLGARVLATQDVPVGLLGNADALRNHVLGAFLDERLGRVSPQIPVPTARAVLEVVSALQPVHDDHRVLEGIGARLDTNPDEVKRWLDILEDAGVLLRGGRLRRVTPDVLGDYVLEERALDNRGVPTGFADQLWEDFGDIAGARLMRNLAELDWRVTHDAGASALLDRIWEGLKKEFETSDAYGRTQLLGVVAEVAVLQPARVLALADVEMLDQARPHEIAAFARWDTVTVQRELAPLVRDAGYKPSLTRRAM